MTTHEPDMFLCAEDRETLAKIRARLAEAREEVARGEWVTDDPLNESDHRTRHAANMSGVPDHLYRWGQGHWHTMPPSMSNWCNQPHGGDALADWARYDKLTICDCPC